MKASSSIAEQLERQSVVPMECTIPTHMTIEQWRRQRSSRARPERRLPTRLFAAARGVVPLRPVPCDHLHEQTTRYDRVEKVLTFLLVCPVCRTEKVVESQHYEPRFQPHAAPQPADGSSGATIHRLPVRRPDRSVRAPVRRAA